MGVGSSRVGLWIRVGRWSRRPRLLRSACVVLGSGRAGIAVEGEHGLFDRSSAPGRIPHRTPAQRLDAIAALRRLRFTGPEIAETLGMALSTVSGILTRIGLGRLRPPRARTTGAH